MASTESLQELKEKYVRLRRERDRLKDYIKSSEVLELLDKGLEALARQIVLMVNDPEHMAYLKEIKVCQPDTKLTFPSRACK